MMLYVLAGFGCVAVAFLVVVLVENTYRAIMKRRQEKKRKQEDAEWLLKDMKDRVDRIYNMLQEAGND